MGDSQSRAAVKLRFLRRQYWVVRDLLTHPEVVHDLDGLLVLDGNVHGDVVVETRADGELLWQGGPVVLTACQRSKINNVHPKLSQLFECSR